MSTRHNQKTSFVVLLFLTTTLIAGFTLAPYSGFASTESNNTLTEPQATQDTGTTTTTTATNATTTTTTTTTNATKPNIILVHGSYVDGSFWSKVIPILQNEGHRVIGAQLPLQSLADDVATVERAIELVGGPTILVGHSYGGIVISNAGYNNSNVTGLVYLAAFAPDEGESLGTFLPADSLPPGFLVIDSGGFATVNPDIFHQALAQDTNVTESNILAAVQKPMSLSILNETSGPPAWKQLPTWYQVSEADQVIPPDAERMFAERINATTLSINSSHVAALSHPDEIAQFILNATKGSTG
jgi:pimeloyl-ACP methyl ester carboxylesterase